MRARKDTALKTLNRFSFFFIVALSLFLGDIERGAFLLRAMERRIERGGVGGWGGRGAGGGRGQRGRTREKKIPSSSFLPPPDCPIMRVRDRERA
jgi:hypothetical protein